LLLIVDILGYPGKMGILKLFIDIILVRILLIVGYPGGLRTITAKDFMEKNPEEMIRRSIKVKLPKNDMRPNFLARVSIYAEGCPELEKLKLPQFSPIKPIDYNKIFGIDNFSPETFKIKDFRGDPNSGNNYLTNSTRI
jgi:hypothetical protein